MTDVRYAAVLQLPCVGVEAAPGDYAGPVFRQPGLPGVPAKNMVVFLCIKKHPSVKKWERRSKNVYPEDS